MKIYLMVINGLGAGSLPDYSKYDDEYHCTAVEVLRAAAMPMMKKMGLAKCCLADLDSKTLGYCYRGRMLTNNTSFASGMDEILGNICVGDRRQIKENLVDVLRKKGVEVSYFSSRQDSFADKIFADDNMLWGSVSKAKCGVKICEMNDFAKYALCGDEAKAVAALQNVDNILSEIYDSTASDDVLIVVGNFGINPSKIGISREYSPIFICSKLLSHNAILRSVQGCNSVAMTVTDLLKVYQNDKSLVSHQFKEKLANSVQSRVGILRAVTLRAAGAKSKGVSYAAKKRKTQKAKK